MDFVFTQTHFTHTKTSPSSHPDPLIVFFGLATSYFRRSFSDRQQCSDMQYYKILLLQRFAHATICPCNVLSVRLFVLATFCPCDEFFATICPQRFVRDDMSATFCPATNCPATICPCDDMSATICPRRFVLRRYVLAPFSQEKIGVFTKFF